MGKFPFPILMSWWATQRRALIAFYTNNLSDHAYCRLVPQEARDSKKSVSTALHRFGLLVWKNYKLQLRHKIQTVTEVVLPLLFTVVLVIVRIIIPFTHVTEPTIYAPMPLENSPPQVIKTKW